jgi:hypothetical protein
MCGEKNIVLEAERFASPMKNEICSMLLSGAVDRGRDAIRAGQHCHLQNVQRVGGQRYQYLTSITKTPGLDQYLPEYQGSDINLFGPDFKRCFHFITVVCMRARFCISVL